MNPSKNPDIKTPLVVSFSSGFDVRVPRRTPIMFQVYLIPEPSSSSVSFQAPLKQSWVELFLTRPTITANKAPTIMSMST